MTDKTKVDLFAHATFNGAAVGKMVDHIITISKTLGHQLHIASVSCCLHVIKHGDPVHMDRLFNGLGGGWRKEALAKFFMKFAPVKFVKGSVEKQTSNAFVVDKDKRAAMLAAYEADPEKMVAEISAKPFWDVTPEKLFPEYNLMAAVQREIAKAKQLATGKKKDGTELTAEEKAKLDLRGLVALEAAFNRLKTGTDSRLAIQEEALAAANAVAESEADNGTDFIKVNADGEIPFTNAELVPVLN